MSPPRSRDPSAPDAAPEAARDRLLQAGLRLFAQRGFAGTSTRELADAAQCNVAAISYYFGDKAGLYRAAFVEPFGDPQGDIARFTDPELSLRDAFRQFYSGLIEPMKQGERALDCMKLHLREMLEPTGMWEAEIEHVIRPMHAALLALLQRHVGCAADLELQRLAVSITGLAIHLLVGHDVIRALQPALNDGVAAHERWVDRLADYAVALVGAECTRRSAEGGGR